MRGICAKIRYRLETIGVCATVLTVETGKGTTRLLASARPIPIPTDTGDYWPIPDTDTGIGLTVENSFLNRTEIKAIFLLQLLSVFVLIQ